MDWFMILDFIYNFLVLVELSNERERVLRDVRAQTLDCLLNERCKLLEVLDQFSRVELVHLAKNVESHERLMPVLFLLVNLEHHSGKLRLEKCGSPICLEFMIIGEIG